MQNRSHPLTLGVAVLALLANTPASTLAGDLPAQVTELRAAWDEANFSLAGDARKEALHSLVETCDTLLPKHADEQAALTWCGIVNSSYAGIASPLSAMKYAKAARANLERALELDQGDMAGAAHTSLGTLYYKVPGWPIGFGDDDKAEQELQAGISTNPDDIDANFFLADFLLEKGRLEEARDYLERAAAAPSRTGRQVADAGRQRDIAALRTELDRKQGAK